MLTIFALAALAFTTGCGRGLSASASSSSDQKVNPILLGASSASVRLDGTVKLSATSNGASVEGGSWSVLSGSSSGSVTADGTYQAPSSMPSSSTVTLNFITASETDAIQLSLLTKIGSVSSVTPNVLSAGTTTVSVQGTGFTTTAQVLLNGSTLPTVFVDSTHLEATATVASTTSTTLPLSVVNQGPGQAVSNSVQVAVKSSPILLSASSSTIRLDGSAVLSAMSDGSPVSGGIWSVVGGPSNGTITSDGTYHAPSLMPLASSVAAVFTSGDQSPSIQLNLLTSIASVTAVNPNVVALGTTKVVVQGSGFTNTAQLLLNGNPVPTVLVDSGHLNGTITLADASSKSLSLAVENAGPGQTPSNSVLLSVKTSPVILMASASSVGLGASVTLTATIDGALATGGVWSIAGGSSFGAISADGTYTAPSSMPASNEVMANFAFQGSTYNLQLSLRTPVANITSVTPNVISLGTTTMAVQGSGFTSTAQLFLNGNAVPTSVVDSGHLVGTITLNSTSSSSLPLSVCNQGSGQPMSSSVQLAVKTDQLQVSPAVLSGGNQSLTITGILIPSGATLTLDGRPMSLTGSLPSSTVTATGYLVPWKTGSVVLNVASSDGTSLTSVNLQIAPTPVSYEAAARFLSQAGFGPRPGLIEHVQTIGFDAFLTEQFQLPGLTYGTDPYRQYLTTATAGTPVLRLRMAWALQNILVRSGSDTMFSQVPWETTLERDAFGSYRQLLLDASSDLSMGLFINLVGNDASTDPNHEPNQNFGREIMQVFTIGTQMLNEDGTLKLDSNGQPMASYDQDTVLALSRAFTGWENPTPVNPNFTMFGNDYSQPLAPAESLHDHSAKILFGSQTLPANQSIVQDRDAALDAVFNHPNVAPYISRLLIQKLVKSGPSSDYIQRVAAKFNDDGNGTRGNLQAVVRAILLDPEARAGDTAGVPSDGFLQDPMFFLTFSMSALQRQGSDDQANYIPKELGESMWLPPSVFGFYSPTYKVPGTSIVSPEFSLLNNISVLQRSQMLWGMVTSQLAGFSDSQSEQGSWLYTNFPDVPSELEALDHMLFFGKMDPNVKASISRYCSQQAQQDKLSQFQLATFLTLNSDAAMVSH